MSFQRTFELLEGKIEQLILYIKELKEENKTLRSSLLSKDASIVKLKEVLHTVEAEQERVLTLIDGVLQEDFPPLVLSESALKAQVSSTPGPSVQESTTQQSHEFVKTSTENLASSLQKDETELVPLESEKTSLDEIPPQDVRLDA